MIIRTILVRYFLELEQKSVQCSTLECELIIKDLPWKLFNRPETRSCRSRNANAWIGGETSQKIKFTKTPAISIINHKYLRSYCSRAPRFDKYIPCLSFLSQGTFHSAAKNDRLFSHANVPRYWKTLFSNFKETHYNF